MKPIFSARTRVSSFALKPATFRPSRMISPEVGLSRQPTRLTSVDLPDPEGPITAIHSPGSTRREKSSSARMTPPAAPALAGYSLLTWLSRIIYSPLKIIAGGVIRSEEHTSELQSHSDLVCRLLLEKKKVKHSRSSATPR